MTLEQPAGGQPVHQGGDAITIAADRRARLETDNPTQVLAAAVTAVLGPEQAGADQVKAAADTIRLLADQRTAVLDIISRAAPTTLGP